MTGGSHDSGAATDAELLQRFVAQRDEGAFTVLVRRHGPAVLGVCRRVLRDPNDADDAFQATFLVLARKAASITRPALLAGWLYGVAYRTAREAKTRAARRRAHERQAPVARPTEPAVEVVWSDLRPVLDEEVNRLPEKYRVTFVLCYLQGLTNEEAAGLLGCPLGTVLSRLAWARDRLRTRLSRRGLALSAGLLLPLNELSAAVPPALVQGTTQAAAAGIVSSQVVTLTQGVLKAMWITKLKAVTSFVLALAVLGGAGVFTFHTLHAKDSKETKKEKTDHDKLQGKWVIASAESEGKKLDKSDPHIKGGTLTFKGDKLIVTMGGKTQEASFSLDPGKTPREFDLVVDEGGGEQTHQGIYSLDGDTFKLCLSHPPQGRPGKFASKEGEKWPKVFVFKRQGK
jgi:RNA polymerase sigma factor (sigma-70 family)